MPEHPQLRAVAFDLDGTLYPSSEVVLPSLGLAFSQLNLFRAMQKVRHELRLKGVLKNFHKTQGELLASKLRISAADAEALVEQKIYNEWFSLFRRFRVYKGVKSLVETIRNRGLKTAVLSDFPIKNRLKDLGLDGLWDLSFSSEDVGALKPHVHSFQELARRLALAPDTILYVGNDYQYDIIGAKNAGFRTAHLTKRPVSGTLADFSFSRYEDLQKWLGSALFPKAAMG